MRTAWLLLLHSHTCSTWKWGLTISKLPVGADRSVIAAYEAKTEYRNLKASSACVLCREATGRSTSLNHIRPCTCPRSSHFRSKTNRGLVRKQMVVPMLASSCESRSPCHLPRSAVGKAVRYTRIYETHRAHISARDCSLAASHSTRMNNNALWLQCY